MARYALHIHASVITQVRFRQGSRNRSAQRDGKGQADDRPRLNAIDRDSVELLFLRGREASILRCPARIVSRELEFGALRKNLKLGQLFLIRNKVPKGSAIVIGAKVQFD